MAFRFVLIYHINTSYDEAQRTGFLARRLRQNFKRIGKLKLYGSLLFVMTHWRETHIYLIGNRNRSEWEFDPEIPRLELAANSPLHAQLCADQGQGCTFPGKVVLAENLVCVGEGCNGKEYSSTTLRTVRVQSDPFPIYYEYVRQPCVEQAFFNNAKRVKEVTSWNPFISRNNMCADPRRDVAVGKYERPNNSSSVSGAVC